MWKRRKDKLRSRRDGHELGPSPTRNTTDGRYPVAPDYGYVCLTGYISTGSTDRGRAGGGIRLANRMYPAAPWAARTWLKKKYYRSEHKVISNGVHRRGPRPTRRHAARLGARGCRESIWIELKDLLSDFSLKTLRGTHTSPAKLTTFPMDRIPNQLSCHGGHTRPTLVLHCEKREFEKHGECPRRTRR